MSPRILITNDDGVDAPGLAHLLQIANRISDDVWVIAPKGNQSGAGHRFTLGHELSLEQRSERIFALDGTPADCAVATFTNVLKNHKPDIVLSGINHGQNVGDIIHCSGTIAGAREGALHGALAIALSQSMDYDVTHPDISWENAIRFGEQAIRAVISLDTQNPSAARQRFYNINFPFAQPQDVTGFKLVPHERYAHSPFEFYPSKNDGKHYVAIMESPKPNDNATDYAGVMLQNAITITPLLLQQSDHGFIQQYAGSISFEGIQ